MNVEIILNLTSNFLGVIAIILSTWAFIISTRNSTYSDLDNGYNEILKIGIEYPRFRNIQFTNNYKNIFGTEDLIRYENYAFMTMNFCETIFDKAIRDKNLLILGFQQSSMNIKYTILGLMNLQQKIYTKMNLLIF